MTCIVAVKDGKGRVIIGGDSAGVAGLDIDLRLDPKVFGVADKFVIGFTSSFRMGQLLMFDFVPTDHPKGMDTYEYMVTYFVECVRNRFKTGGYLKLESGVERGGTFIVGYEGRIFQIQSDFQVAETIENYTSTGCGSPYAMGSLFATDKTRMSATKKVIAALKAAEYFSGGVSSPFNVVTLHAEK